MCHPITGRQQRWSHRRQPARDLQVCIRPERDLQPEALCVLGPGCVVDLAFLCRELADLEGKGISTANLRVSDRAHLLMPWHVALDRLDERERGRKKLGTTGMGVGPAYSDKVGRHGIQVYEVLDPKRFRARVKRELETKNAILERFGDAPLDGDEIADGVLAAADKLGDRIVDTLPLVESALAKDARVLLEGQLGAMRDLDWGIYPYVTSSNPLAGGASVGAGIPPRRITRVIGVVKAYSTAVGEGPFPTELRGDEATALRERAHEYGATTGRPRRVGWFDAVAARHAHRLNAFTELAVTKLRRAGRLRADPFLRQLPARWQTNDDMRRPSSWERAGRDTRPRRRSTAITGGDQRRDLRRKRLHTGSHRETVGGAGRDESGVGPKGRPTLL